jgi:hypothetical protein
VIILLVEQPPSQPQAARAWFLPATELPDPGQMLASGCLKLALSIVAETERLRSCASSARRVISVVRSASEGAAGLAETCDRAGCLVMTRAARFRFYRGP